MKELMMFTGLIMTGHYENTIAITDDGCEILTMLPEEKEALGVL